MKKVKLLNPENISGNGRSSYFYHRMAYLNERKDGVKIATSCHSCREELTKNMRRGISTLQTDKMRLLFYGVEPEHDSGGIFKAFGSWMSRACNTLNLFEKEAGWPLTQTYELETGRSYINAYYFHSSRRWVKSPYMVSFYTLLIRASRDKNFAGHKDLASLEKKINKIFKKGGCLAYDTGYIKRTLPYWRAIIFGYKDMFRKKKIDYYWSTERLSGSQDSGYHEGIDYLCSGSTCFDGARRTLLKVQKELNSK